MPQVSSHGLIVFIWETSKNLGNNVVELRIQQVISIVKEKKLPFILCLKHADVNNVKSYMILLNEAMKTLRVGLITTHLIIKAETPFRKFDGLDINRTPLIL